MRIKESSWRQPETPFHLMKVSASLKLLIAASWEGEMIARHHRALCGRRQRRGFPQGACNFIEIGNYRIGMYQLLRERKKSIKSARWVNCQANWFALLMFACQHTHRKKWCRIPPIAEGTSVSCCLLIHHERFRWQPARGFCSPVGSFGSTK